MEPTNLQVGSKKNFKAGKRRVSYVFATSSHTGGKSQRVFHVCSFAGFVLTRLNLLIIFDP